MTGAVKQSARDWMATGGGLLDAVFSSSNASFLRRRAMAKRIKAARAKEKMNLYEKQAQAASVAAKAASVASSKVVRVKSRSPDKGPAVAAARAASSAKSTASDCTLPSSLRGHQGTQSNGKTVPGQQGPAFTTQPMMDQPYQYHHQQQEPMHHLHGGQTPGHGQYNPQPTQVQQGLVNPTTQHQANESYPPPPHYAETGQVNLQNSNQLHASSHHPTHVHAHGHGQDHHAQHSSNQPHTHYAHGHQHSNVQAQQPVPTHQRHDAMYIQPSTRHTANWVQNQVPGQTYNNQDGYRWAHEPHGYYNASVRPNFYNWSPENTSRKDSYTQTEKQVPSRPERDNKANQSKKPPEKQGRQVSFSNTTSNASEEEIGSRPSSSESVRIRNKDRSNSSTGGERHLSRDERVEEVIRNLPNLKTDAASNESDRFSKPIENPRWTDSRDKRLVDLRCRLSYGWHEIAEMLHSTVGHCVDRFVELIDEGLVKQPADSGKRWEPFEDRALRQLREGRCNSQFSACLMGRSVKEVNDRYISMKEHDFEQTRRRGEAENCIWGESNEGSPEELRRGRSNEANTFKKSALKNKYPSRDFDGRSEGPDEYSKNGSSTQEGTYWGDNNKGKDKQQNGKQNERAKGKNGGKGENRSPTPEVLAQSGRESTVDDADSFYNEKLHGPRRPDRYYGMNLGREAERFAKLKLLEKLVQESPKNVSYDTYWRIIADRFGAATGFWPTLKELADLADLNQREAWSEAMRLLGWMEASRTRQKYWD